MTGFFSATHFFRLALATYKRHIPVESFRISYMPSRVLSFSEENFHRNVTETVIRREEDKAGHLGPKDANHARFSD